MFQYLLVTYIVDENAYGIVAIGELYGERVKKCFDESKFEIGVGSQRCLQRFDVVLTATYLCTSRWW